MFYSCGEVKVIYKSQFKIEEKSINLLTQDVVDAFLSMVQKGKEFSIAVAEIIKAEGISENEVLNILGMAELSYEETAKAMKTMVARMNTAKLKSRQGKAPINVKKAEELWDKAKELAKKQGKDDNYAYVMQIWKNLTGYRKPRKKK